MENEAEKHFQKGEKAYVQPNSVHCIHSPILSSVVLCAEMDVR